MAAPPSKTITSLDGKWLLHKTHSQSPDPVLALQGISWLTRKAIGLAAITQHLRTHTSPPPDDPSGEPVLQIDIEQKVTSGVQGTTEKRCLDWKDRPHSDWLFGDVVGRTRLTTLAVLEEENKGKGVLEEDVKFLAQGWLDETAQGQAVDSYVENEKAGWTAWQIWGFAEVEDQGVKERWLTRRFVVRKGNKVERIQMCYAWVGELDS